MKTVTSATVKAVAMHHVIDVDSPRTAKPTIRSK